MRMLMVFLLKYIFKYKALFDLFALSPIFNLFKLYSVLDQLNAWWSNKWYLSGFIILNNTTIKQLLGH